MPEKSNKTLSQVSLLSGIFGSVLIPIIVSSLLFSNSIDFMYLTSLSKLGENGSDTAFVFNSSLIIGGILLVVFAIGLSRNSSFIGKLGIGIFIFAAISLTFVGVFNIPHIFHNLSAMIFFVSLPTSLLIMGQHVIKNSKENNSLKFPHNIGYGTFGSGIVMWSLNLFLIITFSTTNFAIFELIIIFISSFWLLVFGKKLL